jgi:hypothetical protein
MALSINEVAFSGLVLQFLPLSLAFRGPSASRKACLFLHRGPYETYQNADLVFCRSGFHHDSSECTDFYWLLCSSSAIH